MIIQKAIDRVIGMNKGCENGHLKQFDRQVVIKVLARCTVRVGFENVIDGVFNNADAQTERRCLGVKNTCGQRVE